MISLIKILLYTYIRIRITYKIEYVYSILIYICNFYIHIIFFQICEELITNVQKWIIGWDDNSNTPYIINDDHVIMFDNPKSLKAKVDKYLS